MEIKNDLDRLDDFFPADDINQVIEDEIDDEGEDVDFDREFRPEPMVLLEKKPEAIVEPKVEDAPTTMREAVLSLISKMPAERQAEMYKLFFEMGLNEDDYLFTYAYVSGQVNLMYKEIPGALQKASEAIKKQSMTMEPVLRRVVNDEMAKLKHEFEQRTELMVRAQVEVSQEFAKNADLYMQAVTKSQSDMVAMTDSVIEQYKVKILETMSKSLKQELPKIVDQHMASLVSSVKAEDANQKFKQAFYGIGLVTCGVVFGNVILSIFRSVAGLF